MLIYSEFKFWYVYSLFRNSKRRVDIKFHLNIDIKVWFQICVRKCIHIYRRWKSNNDITFCLKIDIKNIGFNLCKYLIFIFHAIYFLYINTNFVFQHLYQNIKIYLVGNKHISMKSFWNKIVLFKLQWPFRSHFVSS